ncbi:MAG: hypothetical protein HY654_03870, partial [Acidobacteria bacterium]|nr:hypothetical protein [Acidobacteriota bacterium]
GIVEVETGESVNNMEALAQWAPLARMRAPFYLYVPSGSVEAARRLCQDNQIEVAEIWSYHTLGDQTRFTLVHRGARRMPAAGPRERRAQAARAPARRATRPAKTAFAKTTAVKKARAAGRPKPRREKAKPTKSARKRSRGKMRK